MQHGAGEDVRTQLPNMTRRALSHDKITLSKGNGYAGGPLQPVTVKATRSLFNVQQTLRTASPPRQLKWRFRRRRVTGLRAPPTRALGPQRPLTHYPSALVRCPVQGKPVKRALRSGHPCSNDGHHALHGCSILRSGESGLTEHSDGYLT
jgi:hypothetical protein